MSNNSPQNYQQYQPVDLDALLQEFNDDTDEFADVYQPVTPNMTGTAGQIPVQNPMYSQPVQTQVPVQNPMYAQPVQTQVPVQNPVYAQPVQTQVPVQNPMYAQPVQPQPQNPAYAQQTQTRRGPQMTNGYMFSFGDEQQTAPGTSAAQTVQAPAAQSTASKQKKSKKKAKNGPVPSVGKRIRDSIILFGMVVIFGFSAMLSLSSGIKQTAASFEQKSFYEDLEAKLLAFTSDSVSTIFEIPKVYVLPWGEQPAPVPNPEGYGEETNADGVKLLTYEDETISVKYWVERLYESDVHFAEVKVAHPTQLRTAYAGGEFGSSVKYMPQEIAQQVNAVIAINADYCGYRSGGILIRQNTMYRDVARGWDILLIDSEGNFHIMNDRDVHSSGVLEEYEIVNSLVFGPSLIIDGRIRLINLNSGCGPHWNEERYSPRTGIGQIGELHYLFCCVEGRSERSRGVYTSQLAQIMLDHGCVQAYNLDGGQSTTIILGGDAMNEPLWGSQRVVTDIIYCATAIPNEGEVAANE